MKLLSEAIKRELSMRPERAKTIAEKLIVMAEEGDLTAINMVFDRLEGKPVQAVEIDQSVTHNLTPSERRVRLLELQARVIPEAMPGGLSGGPGRVLPVKHFSASDVMASLIKDQDPDSLGAERGYDDVSSDT